jgi:hypothetical protein
MTCNAIYRQKARIKSKTVSQLAVYAKGLNTLENLNTVSSATMFTVLMLTGRITLDKLVNAACTMQIFAYTCWLLCDFIDQCQDIRFDAGPNFFYSDPF